MLASKSGCELDDQTTNEQILLCLQQADPSQIASVLSDRFLHSDPDNFISNPFVPLNDCDHGAAPIFTQDPLLMMQAQVFNDVPLIIGTNKDEGMTFLPKFLPPNPHEFVQKNINSSIPQLLFGRSNAIQWMSQISQLYFGTLQPEINHQAMSILSQIFTDVWFQMPAILTSQTLAKFAQSPIFLYSYEFHGSTNICDLVNFSLPQFLAKMAARSFLGQDLFTPKLACHGDEILLMFKSCAIPLNSHYTAMDVKMASNLLQARARFFSFFRRVK